MPCRLPGNAVSIVEQYDRAGAPRHQLADQEFEAAVRRVDRQQRMPGAMRAFLAHIEKRDLACVAEPSPDGPDVDGFRCRIFGHCRLPISEPLVRGCDRSASVDWPVLRRLTRETAP